MPGRDAGPVEWRSTGSRAYIKDFALTWRLFFCTSSKTGAEMSSLIKGCSAYTGEGDKCCLLLRKHWTAAAVAYWCAVYHGSHSVVGSSGLGCNLLLDYSYYRDVLSGLHAHVMMCICSGKVQGGLHLPG